MSISLVKKVRAALSNDEPAPFEPSAGLVRQFRHARRLNRNVRQSSVFNPRLHRRAAQAAMAVRALDAHERRVFKEANA